MSKILFNKEFPEHVSENVSSVEKISASEILFKKEKEKKCVEITQDKQLKTNFYIGVDWIVKNEIAIYVAPKLNDAIQKINYLKMLFACLRHSDVASHTSKVYEIKFEEPFIEIQQKQDLLTPFLMFQFLQILKSIVRKGLKKSYYLVERNLNAKVKGKVLVSQTLKYNLNNSAQTYCRFDEFGYNTIENRILKKALNFAQKYLAFFPEYYKLVSSVLNYCVPAFQEVDENIELRSLKTVVHNSFYKEYEEGLRVANLILRRFGYNIKNIESQNNNMVKTPPFWIDMPKLFELYVLGLLKDKFHNDIRFQIQGTYGHPDFVLVNNEQKMIIDTKYKTKYEQEEYQSEDIRQLSGYSRDVGVLEKLGYKKEEQDNTVVDCLIIYPDQNAPEILPDDLKKEKIEGFTKFYKAAIKLPIQ